MNADVSAGRERRLKLIPQLWRLVAKIPVAMLVAGRKISLFRPRAFFVGPNPQDDTGIAFLLEQLLEAVGLERGATCDASHRVVHACRERFFILSHDQVEMPFPRKSIAIFNHGRDFEARVYVKQWKWHVPEKGLPREPEQYG